MAVGLILLWPTLFWLDGDTPEAQEYAHLTGEYKALEKALSAKCTNGLEKPVQAAGAAG
jgi:hypothetical protein